MRNHAQKIDLVETGGICSPINRVSPYKLSDVKFITQYQLKHMIVTEGETVKSRAF